jgi:hypothetical protein
LMLSLDAGLGGIGTFGRVDDDEEELPRTGLPVLTAICARFSRRSRSLAERLLRRSSLSSPNSSSSIGREDEPALEVALEVEDVGRANVEGLDVVVEDELDLPPFAPLMSSSKAFLLVGFGFSREIALCGGISGAGEEAADTGVDIRSGTLAKISSSSLMTRLKGASNSESSESKSSVSRLV